jgi:hypothetical protein
MPPEIGDRGFGEPELLDHRSREHAYGQLLTLGAGRIDSTSAQSLFMASSFVPGPESTAARSSARLAGVHSLPSMLP